MDQLEPNTASYNIPNPVRLRGTLDVESLENAISEIVRRHESLRTRFGKSGGEPVQLIDAASPVPLPAIDLTEIDEGKREAAAVSLAHEEAQQPFSLADGPLIRTKLLRLKADDHVLLLTIHHIVADGWSLGIFLRELVVLYGAFSSRSPSPLPELPIQFGDYAVWQREWLRGETLEAELAFWKERLGGTLPILDLPTDYPRPKMMTFRGRAQSTMLIPEFSEQLETLCHRTATTPYMVLLAVFETLMFRYTGLEDILVGSPFTNRNRVEIEGLIGFFVNTLVLRTSLSGHPTFEELLRRVRDVTLSTYAHQDVPFEKLVETLQPERDPGRNPIFQVMFALQNAPMNLPLMKDISLEPFEFDSSIAHFDLSIVMSKLESGYSVVLEYNTDLFSDETMMRVLGHFERLLGAAVEKPQKRLLDLPLLQPAEHEELMTRTQAIENRLAQHSAVERCVVLRNEIAPLDQSLVAYLISRGASVPTDAEFDHYLKAGLNGASGSITYIQLDALPLMDDGQLNLSELHRIRASRFLRTSHMQAGNSIQKGQSQSPDSAESRKSELAARRARLSAAKGVLLEKRLRGEK